MRIYSAMFAATTAPPSRPSLTAGRGAPASFAAGARLAPCGRYAGRFVEFGVGALALALFALPAPARAQTVTISSVTASPASVQPGQAVTFTATMTASQNLSNYPVEFSLVPPGASGTNTMQGLYSATFKAGASLTEAYSWTVPAGTKAGTYTLYVAVYNPAYSVKYAQKTTTLTVTAASAAARRRIWSRRWSAARPRSATPSRQRPEPGRAQRPMPISGPGTGRRSRGRRRRRTPLSRATPDTR